MATLNIEGRRVQVDDSFLQLSPEQQAATVEEIAGQIGVTAAQQPNTAAKADALPQQQEFSDFDSTVLGIANGLLQNFGAEAAGVIEGVAGVLRGENFNEARVRGTEQADAMLQRASAENPVAFGGGEITGSIGTAIVPGAAALKGATGLQKAAQLGAVGAAQGAVFGAGEQGNLQERAASAGTGAAAGAAFGAGAVPAGRLIGKVARSFTGKNKMVEIPDSDQLRDLAGRLYQEAEEAGVQITGEKMQRIAAALRQEARKLGSRPKLTTPIETALDAFENEAQGIATLADVDLLRQVLKVPAGDLNPNVRRIAGALTDRLDDLLDGLGRHDLAPGSADPKLALDALKDARGLWRRMRKNEIIETAFEKAKDDAAANFTQSGFENSLRRQLKSVKRNPKLWRQFDADEKKAMIAAIRPNAKERTLRLAGKFAPRGVVSAAVSIGGGSAVGGPVGAMALPAIGSIAANAADRTARKGAQALSDLVRNGGALPVADDTALQVLAARGLIGAGRTVPESRQ